MSVQEAAERWRKLQHGEKPWQVYGIDKTNAEKIAARKNDLESIADAYAWLFDPTPLTADVLREHGFDDGGSEITFAHPSEKCILWVSGGDYSTVSVQLAHPDIHGGIVTTTILELYDVGMFRRWLQLTGVTP